MYRLYICLDYRNYDDALLKVLHILSEMGNVYERTISDLKYHREKQPEGWEKVVDGYGKYFVGDGYYDKQWNLLWRRGDRPKTIETNGIKFVIKEKEGRHVSVKN